MNSRSFSKFLYLFIFAIWICVSYSRADVQREDDLVNTFHIYNDKYEGDPERSQRDFKNVVRESMQSDELPETGEGDDLSTRDETPKRRTKFLTQLDIANALSAYREGKIVGGRNGWIGGEKMAAYLARQQHKSESIWDGITCDVCYAFVYLVRGLIEGELADDVIIDAAKDFCILFKVEDEKICDMIVDEYADEILYLAKYLSMDPWQACSIALSEPCNGSYFPGQNWTVTFPNTTKPEPRPPIPPQPSAPTLRVLHLTDLHLDYEYREGSEAECDEPLCCRDNDGAAKYASSAAIGNERAGKYGHFGTCDIPSITIVSLFEQLQANKEQFDYVLFTGDIPAHDIWNQSQSDQLHHLYTLDGLFQTYLPGVPIYWAVGNHESAPCDSFVIPGLGERNMSWLYEPLAEVWGRWLPESALDTVRSCGGYSFSPYDGFRIISLNTNYCNKNNPWILLNTTDPCDVLQWFISELQQAEDKNEKVHLLLHAPPGSSVCLQFWSYNFYDIINRYENTVVNQFYGHNHHDWYQMFYDNKEFQRPLGVGFVTPAVTSRDDSNPVYRIYTVDGNYKNSSWAVLDYTNYFLNLTEANDSKNATWKISYNPKQDLGMKSLYAADFEDLLQRMEQDDDLFQKFYTFYYNHHAVNECDEDCKDNLLCDLKEGRSYDTDMCTIHH